jgi:hypothetical protein
MILKINPVKRVNIVKHLLLPITCFVTKMRIRLIISRILILLSFYIKDIMHTPQNRFIRFTRYTQIKSQNQGILPGIWPRNPKHSLIMCTLCISVNINEGETHFCLVRLKAV